MSYQLRPIQAQEPQEQQQQQQGSEYGTYNGNGNVYPPSQQQQQYPQYPIYQWPAAGYPSDAAAAAAAAAAGQPIYWAQDPAMMTIPPPVPPKSPFSDKYAGSNVGTDVPSSGYPHSLPARTLPSQNQGPRICGVKRNSFYILVAVACFLLVLGIATGVGVGLAMNHSTPSDTSSSSNATATSTQSAPTPSFTGTLVSAPVTCPQNNNTVYLAASSSPSKAFNVECGHDYSSNDGAKDITQRKGVDTMAECLDLCGARAECVGVGYGDFEGTWTCWLKSQLGQPNNSPQWYAARLQDVD